MCILACLTRPLFWVATFCSVIKKSSSLLSVSHDNFDPITGGMWKKGGSKEFRCVVFGEMVSPGIEFSCVIIKHTSTYDRYKYIRQCVKLENRIHPLRQTNRLTP